MKTDLKDKETLFQEKINAQLQAFQERVMFAGFECFKQEKNNSFLLFKEEIERTNQEYLYSNYPVARKIYKHYQTKIRTLFSFIQQAFEENKEALFQQGLIALAELKIEDIEIGVGDFHKGESTAIITLNNEQKLVYKPTESNISTAYFQFLNWFNKTKQPKQGKYKIVDQDNYHWLEFVEYEGFKTEKQIKEYYQKAGALLCITYVLNSSDFHYENLIVSKKNPVLIDHETVIQPKISENLRRFFKNFEEGIEDTVLSTMLLPKPESSSGLPVGSCGFGDHKQTKYTGLKKMSVNLYTDDWKMVTRIVSENLFKQNIPLLKGERIYPKQFLNDLVDGFESCYLLFLKEKTFLSSEFSPLRFFDDTTVRFIWRPTNVYAKILNKVNLPKNLKSPETYEKMIRDYLKVAFKNVPKDSNLWLIYEHEVKQMLEGDIPFFEVNGSSRDLHTEFGIIKDFFELSSVENLARKLYKLSKDDLEYQKKIIIESIG